MNNNFIGSLIAGARFVHCDDTDLDALLNNQLNAIRQSRVEAHLGICLKCESRYTELKSLRRWQTVVQLVAYLAYLPLRTGKPKTKPPVKKPSNDKLRAFILRETKERNLIVYLESAAQESVEMRYLLYLEGHDEIGWPFKFKRQADGTFLGTIEISSEERHRLPSGARKWNVREQADSNSA